ncbi:MAG: hypothetical protein QME62_05180 [Armatimonadota bacterium]|nr:hypothetical protein [Armatimonadota bacterium]
MDRQNTQKPIEFSSRWVNIDGRLGVIAVAGSGLAYVQASGYNEQAVYADVLYGSFSNRKRQFKAGDQIVHRVIVFVVETSPEETSVISENVMIKETLKGRILHLKLPAGEEYQFSLM